MGSKGGRGMRYWITYYQYLGSGCEGDTNEIISDHPLVWLKNHPDFNSMTGSKPHLKDWKEIPDSVAAYFQGET
jgi:hypothetical protein